MKISWKTRTLSRQPESRETRAYLVSTFTTVRSKEGRKRDGRAGGRARIVIKRKHGRYLQVWNISV